MTQETAPANAPPSGAIFADRYRVERLLGVGGMGFVIAASDLGSGQRVAIKMLLPELVRDPPTVERFLREARAAVKIGSEHVARILGVGELPDRTPYLVMEYLDGTDLAGVILRGAVSVDRAVDWVLEAAEAIAEAHAMKTVHRDLKPANLFLARRHDGSEIIKVLDFGISKLLGDGNLAMTKTSAVMGSPLYMSPEQLKSARDVDERSDIWALGVIVFELIHGSPPFMATTLAELGALVLSGEAPRLLDIAPGTPPGLSAVIATCLRTHPQDRFVNLADFADAIAPFGGRGARESVHRIVATLGMPSARATLATPSASDRAVPVTLTRTQPFAAGGPSAREASGSSPELHPPPAYGVTASPRKGGNALLAILAAAAVVLLVFSGRVIYGSKVFRRTATEAPQATVPVIVPAPSASVAPPSEAPSAVTVAVSSSVAPGAPARDGKSTRPVAARHPTVTSGSIVPPPASAAAPLAKPGQPSGFAVDPKN